jgi:hypothetical protein
MDLHSWRNRETSSEEKAPLGRRLEGTGGYAGAAGGAGNAGGARECMLVEDG